MKKNIINILLSGAVVLGMASCSENEWNEKFLEGFESDSYYDPTASGTTYTLTDADYASISGTMKKLAQTSEEEALADNIKNTLSFDKNSIYNAKFAIPYFLNTSTNPEYNAPVGSTVDIVYAETGDTPEESLNLMQAARYTVSTANYQEAWGSETDYIDAYSPSKPASSYLPNVLGAAITDATNGQYAIVSYNQASTDPVFGGSSDEPGTGDEGTLTSVIKNLAVGDELTATAAVTGITSRGLVFTDNAGSIFYYVGTSFDQTAWNIGDIVEISGTVGQNNNGLQLGSSATVTKKGNEDYEYPTPTVYTGAQMDQAIQTTDNFQPIYCAIKGNLNISGTYYNVTVEGAETAVGSVYYPSNDIIDKLKSGNDYTFYGYFMAISKQSGAPKFFNIVVTSVGSADDDPSETYTITSAIKDLTLNADLTATGVVTALSARGVVVTDNAGSILYYQQSGFSQADYPVGTVVNIKGTVGAYNNGFQLDQSKGATIEAVGTKEYTYPSPTVYTGTMMDEAIQGTDNFQPIYATIQGTLSISGTYYNVTVPGATTATGSLYYVNDAIKAGLQNDTEYTFYGYFQSISKQSGAPKFFNFVVTKFETSSAATLSMFAARAATNNVAVEQVNAVYFYNGSKWAPAEGVVALNPSDYTAMGFSNNQLSDPNIYLPIWLKQQKPYAQEGDEVYVVYNTNNVGFFVYNNGTWTLNNNGYEVVTGRFIRKAYKWEATDWEFQKYVGKQTYVLFDQDEIQLDATYLLAFDNVCATPVPTTSNYGYLLPYEFAEDEGAVTLSSDYYGFTFATTCVYDDVEYTAPEGMFMLVDANGSYYYLQGTYQSFNIRKTGAPYIDGGAISPQYLYKAVNNGDGTWSITNDNADSGTRTIYYSTGYNNFAAYFSQKDADHLIKLYKLSDGTEEDAEGEGEGE